MDCGEMFVRDRIAGLREITYGRRDHIGDICDLGTYFGSILAILEESLAPEAAKAGYRRTLAELRSAQMALEPKPQEVLEKTAGFRMAPPEEAAAFTAPVEPVYAETALGSSVFAAISFALSRI